MRRIGMVAVIGYGARPNFVVIAQASAARGLLTGASRAKNAPDGGSARQTPCTIVKLVVARMLALNLGRQFRVAPLQRAGCLFFAAS